MRLIEYNPNEGNDPIGYGVEYYEEDGINLPPFSLSTTIARLRREERRIKNCLKIFSKTIDKQK